MKNKKHNVRFLIIGIILNFVISGFIAGLYKQTFANFEDDDKNPPIVAGEIYMMDNFMLDLEEYKQHAKRKTPISTLEQVKNNIKSGLKNRKRTWDDNDINKLADVLQFGEMEFDIDHTKVLSIINIESKFKIDAINVNTNKSKDYGLTQINGPNWKHLSKYSIKILNKYEIEYDYNKFNIALNVMNCFIYLNSAKNYLKKQNKFSEQKWIQSYNVGVAGAFMTNENIQKRRTAYWRNFQRSKHLFI